MIGQFEHHSRNIGTHPCKAFHSEHPSCFRMPAEIRGGTFVAGASMCFALTNYLLACSDFLSIRVL